MMTGLLSERLIQGIRPMPITNRKTFALILVISSFFVSGLFSQTKLAQTGFQFLSVGADARAAAMANAMTTQEWGSAALFANPAGMATMSTLLDVAASRNYWIAGIDHNQISVALSPFNGQYGVLGITLHSVNYGAVEGTMQWDNYQGYIDTEVFYPSSVAVGVGYARALSDRFQVGAHVRRVGQYLGESVVELDTTLGHYKNIAFATAVDFGTIFKTDFKGLVFGMSVRNFSEEIVYEREPFQLPLVFRLGISMNLFDLMAQAPDGKELMIRVDALHPRAYREQVNIGLEYSLVDRLFLRGGYTFDIVERGQDSGSKESLKEYGLTFGFGLEFFGLAVDYAYTPFGVFDNVQRFTVRFAM
jgi:hypothetical protein